MRETPTQTGDTVVVAACSAAYPTWKNDCSGFLRAVAAALGYTLRGNADSLVDYFRDNWTSVATGAQAAQFAAGGEFVVAGLKSSEHSPARNNGHVVVVVSGSLYRNTYPMVWGGSIGSAQSAGTKSVGEVWNRTDRDKVQYWKALTPPVARQR